MQALFGTQFAVTMLKVNCPGRKCIVMKPFDIAHSCVGGSREKVSDFPSKQNSLLSIQDKSLASENSVSFISLLNALKSPEPNLQQPTFSIKEKKNEPAIEKIKEKSNVQFRVDETHSNDSLSKKEVVEKTKETDANHFEKSRLNNENKTGKEDLNNSLPISLFPYNEIQDDQEKDTAPDLTAFVLSVLPAEQGNLAESNEIQNPLEFQQVDLNNDPAFISQMLTLNNIPQHNIPENSPPLLDRPEKSSSSELKMHPLELFAGEEISGNEQSNIYAAFFENDEISLNEMRIDGQENQSLERHSLESQSQDIRSLENQIKEIQSNVNETNGNKEHFSEVTPKNRFAVEKSHAEAQKIDSPQNSAEIYRPDTAKIIIKNVNPLNNASLFITPMLITTMNVNVKTDVLDTAAFGIEGDSSGLKTFSFVDASSQQKQEMNRDGGENNSSESNSFMSDGKKGTISERAMDSVQRTSDIQKLMQTIRDRTSDAIKEKQNDKSINVMMNHLTLGEVEMGLKIKNNKISINFLSKNKNMQKLLNQERADILSILNGLVKSTEYSLEDNPIQILNNEKEF